MPALNLSAAVAAANALPYVKAPFSQGFTVNDYRALHHEHAARVRWWKAVQLSAGFEYIDQTLDESVRAFIFANALEIETPEFGLIRVGDIRFSAIPDEIELSKDDRILALDNPRLTTHSFTPSGEASDQLPRLYVHSIDSIADDEGEIVADTYELSGRSIVWAGTPPTGEIVVRYRFLPQYEFRGEGDKQAFLGSDGGRLPQIVPLHLLGIGKENE